MSSLDHPIIILDSDSNSNSNSDEDEDKDVKSVHIVALSDNQNESNAETQTIESKTIQNGLQSEQNCFANQNDESTELFVMDIVKEEYEMSYENWRQPDEDDIDSEDGYKELNEINEVNYENDDKQNMVTTNLGGGRISFNDQNGIFNEQCTCMYFGIFILQMFFIRFCEPN